MAQKISSSPSTKKISDLIGLINRGELILQPEFQRKLVWNDKHKEAFIDTVLKGYPFPEIYIAQSGIDLQTLRSQQVVVDGQQRLSTIKQYVEGSLYCKNLLSYRDLSDNDKKDFLNYDVVIRDLKDANSETIKEIFRRINQTKYNLNSVEIQNAIYDGEFITTAKDILNSFDNNLLPIFSETELSRMGDLNYILLLMATNEEGGYFQGNTQTEYYIEKYNNEYPNSNIIKTNFIALFKQIIELNLSAESMWFRKSNFFTLFVELVGKHFEIDELAQKLNQFESNVISNKDNKDSDYGVYYAKMYTGTNSRTARVERGNMFKKYITTL